MLAKAFIAFAQEPMIRRISKGIIWEKADDYVPKRTDRDYVRKSDVPWLDRFAAAGGHAIISGDVQMGKKPHEKLALYNHGFVVIFFELAWSRFSSLRRSALMLHWWEEIVTKIITADHGTFWVVPCVWPAAGGELRNASLGLAKLLKDSQTLRKKKRAPRKREAVRPTPAKDRRQEAFLDKLGDT